MLYQCNNCKCPVQVCGGCGYALGVNNPILTHQEIKLILDFLSDQYIDYENTALHKLLKEMRAWLESQF